MNGRNVDIKYINWNDVEYPVLFGHIAIQDYEEETGEPFQEAGQNLRKHARILWFAIKCAYEDLEKDFFIKDEDGNSEPVISIKECLKYLNRSFPIYFGIMVKSFSELTDMTVEELIEKGSQMDQAVKDAKKKSLKEPTGKK